MDKMFIKNYLYIMRLYKRDPSEYGKNMTRFYTIHFSIEWVLVYSSVDWLYIPYVLIYNKREFIQIQGKFNAIWYKHGVSFSYCE